MARLFAAVLFIFFLLVLIVLASQEERAPEAMIPTLRPIADTERMYKQIFDLRHRLAEDNHDDHACGLFYEVDENGNYESID